MATHCKTALIEGFNVRIVEAGDAYGNNGCVTHEGDEPLVEFYDAKQDKGRFGPLGQFVSRYYCSTLLEHQYPQGLNLQGGVWEWSVSPAGMIAVAAHIRSSTSQTAQAV